MDDSHHSNRYAIPNDENEQNYQQMGDNLKNLKKPVAKNYMSPTISAASKAVAPRKKILGERNEVSEPSSFDANIQKISTFDNTYERFSQSEPKSPSVSQSEFYDEDRDGDLSSKPYDPLTNYLSPRPQFLRYNPNRRREIFRAGENGAGEEEEITSGSGSFNTLKGIDDEAASDSDFGSLISGGGSPPAQEDGETEGANEETEESDEEEIEEEEEEKKGCNLKGVLKTMLLLAVFILSTMFISSMNPPTPFWEDGFRQMQNQTFEIDFVKSLESGNFFSQQKEAQKLLMEEKSRVVSEGVEEGSVEEIERSYELNEAVNLESGKVDAVEVAESYDVGELVEPQIEVNEEMFNQMVGHSEYQGVEPIEKVEVSDENQTQLSSEERDSGSYASNSFESQSGVAENPGEEVHNEEATYEDVQTDFLFKVLIGVLSFSTIVAFLSLFFRLRKKKNTVKKDSFMREKPRTESQLAEQEKFSGKDSSSLPSQPFTEEERRRSVLPTRENDNIDQVYSLGKIPSPAIHYNEKASGKEYSESRAPTVEFLGEFVVREVRRPGKENITKASEESNYSVSSEKTFGSKSHSVSVQAHQTRSEFSIMDSPSYGSYTAEKETVKKADARDGEANVVTTPTPTTRRSSRNEVAATTPVRRSGRIRNRAMSP